MLFFDKRKLLLKIMLWSASLLGSMSCGMLDSDYRDYGQTQSSAGNGPSGSTLSCDEQILVSFASIQKGIEGTCGNLGCHGDGTGNGLFLQAGKISGNENSLWSFTGGNPEKLINKLNGSQSHQGGTQIPGTISAGAVKSWHQIKNSGCE